MLILKIHPHLLIKNSASPSSPRSPFINIPNKSIPATPTGTALTEKHSLASYQAREQGKPHIITYYETLGFHSIQGSGSEQAKVSHVSPPEPQCAAVSAERVQEFCRIPRAAAATGKENSRPKTNAGKACIQQDRLKVAAQRRN